MPTTAVSASDYADQIQQQLDENWLPRIYLERILKLRTRSYRFPALNRSTTVDIQHTLLGVELKLGRRRLLCPDLATARYLSVFARTGCQNVAIPYDITKISQLADELESSWYRMLLLVDFLAANESQQLRNRIRGLLIARIFAEVSRAGAGTEVPEFRQSTKQRS
jgi:hypothetical protein